MSLYAADEERCIEVTLDAPGQLGQVLGERIHEVDSLVVKGLMDNRDFEFIKTAYDKSDASVGIRVINIEGAEVENNTLPSGAFSGIYYRLERIMLPDNITEFKKDVFAGCNARTINIPSALRTIKRGAFENSYVGGVVELPEGVTEIPRDCFRLCDNLTGVKLPSTVKKIGDCAFEKSMVRHVDMPEGLESIGTAAFLQCDSLEGPFVIPSTVSELGGSVLFWSGVSEIEFPAGAAMIPMQACMSCADLSRVVIQGATVRIGSEAFCGAKGLVDVVFRNERIDEIGKSAFEATAIRTLILPANVDVMCERSFFDIPTLKTIYSPSAMPPAAQSMRVNGRSPEYFAFGGTTPSDVTVYVPVGSAEAYRSCWGWDYFSNFVETDQWPDESGIDGIVAGTGNVGVRVADGRLVVDGVADGAHLSLYDLAGRCVLAAAVSGDSVELPALNAGVYIVTVGGKSVKVRL